MKDLVSLNFQTRQIFLNNADILIVLFNFAPNSQSIDTSKLRKLQGLVNDETRGLVNEKEFTDIIAVKFYTGLAGRNIDGIVLRQVCGVKLDGRPTRPGLYICNGRKTVVSSKR